MHIPLFIDQLAMRLSHILAFTPVAVVNAAYTLGTGVGDITGPVVETNMMGYASLAQTDTGMRMRQYARAFLVASGNDRVMIVNTDTGMGDNGIRRSLLKAIAADATLSALYNDQNVALLGTHQHSGVGGYLENLLPQVTALGYVKQTADAIVAGSLVAIRQAHTSAREGTISWSNTTLLNTNINRSPTAYLANPAEERARYQYDQDKEFSLVNFVDSASQKSRGFLGFYAVHGTSVYENNTLVNGDNKGYAAWLAEQALGSGGGVEGKGSFVAGFIQATVGDTSPNTLGAFCESPGQPYNNQPCEAQHSTCGNKTEECHGRGPAFNQDSTGWASMKVIGGNQWSAAMGLLGGQGNAVSGSVRSVHVYVNMSQYHFTLANGTAANTCPPAMGYSFAGGTTDGPGAFDFVQGDNSTSQNPFWELVKGVITPPPNDQQKACHAPKPILLNTGYAKTPYLWQPDTVNIQLLRVGQLIFIIFPGELTTMAGRRLKSTVLSSVASSIPNAKIFVAGPSNTYSHYVTTREEYGVQRYEGASTIYGPNTLEAYQDIFGKLVRGGWIADSKPSGNPPFTDSAPPDQSGSYISLQTGVVFDTPGIGHSFGDVQSDARGSYGKGEMVSVKFVGANPRNDLKLGSTFFGVDQFVSGAWTQVRSDAWPSTSYEWLRTSTIIGTSSVTTNWTIESNTPSGTYRLTYYGNAKSITGSISAFTGHSRNFTVS